MQLLSKDSLGVKGEPKHEDREKVINWNDKRSVNRGFLECSSFKIFFLKSILLQRYFLLNLKWLFKDCCL